MNRERRRRGLAAPVALPVGFAALLVVGAVATSMNGGLPAAWVFMLAAAIVAAASLVAEPAAAPLLGLVGWLTVAGFSRHPYAQLRLTGALSAHAAVTMAICCLAGAGLGALMRRLASSYTLWVVDISGDRRFATGAQAGHLAGQPQAGQAGQPLAGQPLAGPPLAGPPSAGLSPTGPSLSARPPSVAPECGARQASLPGGIDRRRRAAGVLTAAAVLPLLTLVLAAGGQHLSLDDDLLIYLVAVVVIAVVGGFWPAVLAAVAASLLLNWYFTPPVHTFTIEKPQNLLALLLFVTVAVSVSSIVHLAARRAIQAAHSAEEAASLLALAQTVLGGADTPAAILDHLTGTLGGRAELLERVSGQWVRVAVSGASAAGAGSGRVEARPDVALVVAGQSRPVSPRLLDGLAAQAAAALDRERLRTQAAQAEMLAAGNRMRTALLAAVSHDLRTPLASIKASVSTLRQPDMRLTAADEAALLAAIEDSADRLDALIGNLLDMSRLNTGSLQPFLRPTAIDEVVPVALRGLDAGISVRISVPDVLPLVRVDPGLLERVLANLFANALSHSPPDAAPSMRASRVGDTVELDVVDHGEGVPDELKTRMFEPFERLGERDCGTGVGLGLAVAKGLAEAMGASVVARDTPGGGLTMRVTLQVASPRASVRMVRDQ